MDVPPVQYAKTSDGVSIAYAVTGEGTPLVFLPVPPNRTMQIAWGFPRPLKPWLEGLSARFRVIEYDRRGTGLSARLLPNISMVAHGLDLEAVVEQLNLQRFVLLASAGQGHAGVRYAVANPERIEALILVACPVSGSAWSRPFFDALPDDDWELFQRKLIPLGLTPAENSNYLDALLESTSRESNLAGLRAALESDIHDILPLVRTPTLVLHSRDDLQPRPEASIRLAALIPDARMVLLDGADMFGDHVQGLHAIDDFIKSLPQRSKSIAGVLSSREIEVLRLLVGGRSNQQIADELVISLNTVRRHVSNILDRTDTSNRTDAVSWAHRNGVV